MAKNLNLETLNNFIAWLDIQLKERGWSDHQLALRAGISHPVISKARSGLQGIGWDACVSITEALGLPPEFVLQKAGHLPEKKDAGPTLEEANHKLGMLPEWQQKMVLHMIDSILAGNANENTQHTVAPSDNRTTSKG